MAWIVLVEGRIVIIQQTNDNSVFPKIQEYFLVLWLQLFGVV